jgi:hypothetical protein
MQGGQCYLQKYVIKIISGELTDETVLTSILIIYNGLIRNAPQFAYRFIEYHIDFRIEDIMNLIQLLCEVQITNDHTQQQMLITTLERLSRTRSFFSTIHKTQLATILTDARSYEQAEREIELVKGKECLSKDEDADSFLVMCKSITYDLYNALHLGRYFKEYMSAATVELIINELERFFVLDLTFNVSSDEQISQALANKLKLSNEDEVVKAIQLIRLLVPMRDAFVKILYFIYYRKASMIFREVFRTRSYKGLDELEIEIKMLKQNFDNSSEISLLFPELEENREEFGDEVAPLHKEGREKFDARVKSVLAAIEDSKDRSRIYFEQNDDYIESQLNALAKHRMSGQSGFMQSYRTIRELVDSDWKSYSPPNMLNEDKVRLEKEYQELSCQFEFIYEAMGEFTPFEDDLLRIRSSKKMIEDTCCLVNLVALTNEHLLRTFEALKRIKESNIAQIVDNLMRAFDIFFCEHGYDTLQFQLLLDDREHLEEFMVGFDGSCEIVEMEFIPFYVRTFELKFKEEVLAASTQLNPDVSDSSYGSLLLSFVGYLHNVACVAKKIDSPEQLISIREMVVRCSEYLVLELSKCNNGFGEISKNTNVSGFTVSSIYEKVINFEHDIDETFSLQEPIITKSLVRPRLLLIRLKTNYMISRKLFKVIGDVSDVRLLPANMHYQIRENFNYHGGIKTYFMIANQCLESDESDENELEILYNDFIKKYDEAKSKNNKRRDFGSGIIGLLNEFSVYIVPVCFLFLVFLYFIVVPVLYIASGYTLSFVLKELIRIYKLTYVKIMFPAVAAISLISIICGIIRYECRKALADRCFDVANEALNRLKCNMLGTVNIVEPLILQHGSPDYDFLQQENPIASESR